MTYPNFELIEYITKEEIKKFCPEFYKVIRFSDCKMDCFVQTWATTALGFNASGGLSGQKFTDAYTTVVTIEHDVNKIGAVFFGNEIAYLFANPGEIFYKDLSQRNMKPQKMCFVYEDKEN